MVAILTFIFGLRFPFWDHEEPPTVVERPKLPTLFFGVVAARGPILSPVSLRFVPTITNTSQLYERTMALRLINRASIRCLSDVVVGMSYFIGHEAFSREF